MADRRQSLPVSGQLRSAFALLVLWASGLFAVLLAGVQPGAELEELFLDPAYVTGSPWYTGLFSNIGILAWTVAVTAAVGGAWVSARAGRPTAATFLISGALVTSLLLADDLLQLHADLLPSTGMRQGFAKVIFIAPVPLWVWANRVEIARTRWLVLGAALAGFGLSLFSEAIAPILDLGSPTDLVVEDSAKLLGILAWAQYFILTTGDITASVITEASDRRDHAETAA